MHVLFLNQYFPPDPAPTGILMRELAEELEAAGHTTEFIDAGKEYRGGQKQKGRLFREATALLRIGWRGIRSRRADVVISGSSPPCLLLIATFVARWHGARSFHWVMDLYPEIAVALGEIRRSWMVSCLEKLMGCCYRRCSRVVALDSDMADRLRRYGIEPAIVRPWIYRSLMERLWIEKSPSSTWTWMYSGNLGRAHEWRTLLDAQAIIEKETPEIGLVFQGGGPSWPAAQAYAESLGLRNCEWRGYAPQEALVSSLLEAQVLVASQLPATQGMLWPSKLGLLLALPRAILWVGPKGGAIARELGGDGVFGVGESEAVARWVLAGGGRKGTRSDPREERTRALRRWREMIG